MTIGIFGGSFDPTHLGHMEIARAVLDEGTVEEVWLMVSPENPLKSGKKMASMGDRLAMARIAVSELPESVRRRIRVSDFEGRMPKPSYTIRTLQALKREYPEDEFRLIIGGDNFENFRKWRESERILDEFGIIVYPRDNQFDARIVINKPRCRLLKDMKLMDVSSTAVREAVAKGEDLSLLTGPGVAQYIKEKGLYDRT